MAERVRGLRRGIAAARQRAQHGWPLRAIARGVVLCRVRGSRLEWSEERSGPRQIALRLCNSRLTRQGIQVIRYNIENLIKLSERFGETSSANIGKCALGK